MLTRNIASFALFFLVSALRCLFIIGLFFPHSVNSTSFIQDLIELLSKVDLRPLVYPPLPDQVPFHKTGSLNLVFSWWELEGRPDHSGHPLGPNIRFICPVPQAIALFQYSYTSGPLQYWQKEGKTTCLLSKI